MDYVLVGSVHLQNELNNDHDANLFFNEDPVSFLRLIYVEIDLFCVIIRPKKRARRRNKKNIFFKTEIVKH